MTDDKLRAALATAYHDAICIPDGLTFGHAGGDTDAVCTIDAGRLAAALASSVSALDVEPVTLTEATLAEALAAWWDSDEGHMPGLDAWDEAGGWTNDARLILREYAALSSKEPTDDR